MPLGVIGLVVWVVGAPLGSYLIIFDERKRLHSREVKAKLGFFYNGYKGNSACWELFTSFKKITIAVSSVFLGSASAIVQSLFLFLILLVEIVMVLKLRPFLERRFNVLVVISTLALIITIYCSIFYSSSRVERLSSFASATHCKLRSP